MTTTDSNYMMELTIAHRAADLRNVQTTVAARVAAIRQCREAADADLAAIERPGFFSGRV